MASHDSKKAKVVRHVFFLEVGGEGEGERGWWGGRGRERWMGREREREVGGEVEGERGGWGGRGRERLVGR